MLIGNRSNRKCDGLFFRHDARTMPGTMPPRGALHAAREYDGFGPCVVASWAVARRRRAHCVHVRTSCSFRLTVARG
eukprot:15168968-Alexandrium_andersonii.AAC.1